MTVMVDSSVWINHIGGRETPSVTKLRTLLLQESQTLMTADLVILEVVRGFRSDRLAADMARKLQRLEIAELGGIDACLRAAGLYRKLQSSGTTVGQTVDLLIASWCIHEGVALLHDDKDFKPLEKLGLRCA